MPRVEARLVFDTNVDRTPPELCNMVLEILRSFESEEFIFLRLQYMTNTLTEDELAEIRWQGEGGPED